MVLDVTGETTNLSPIVTVPNTADMQVGQYVFATQLPDNTTIISIDGPTQITVSANATATSGSAALRFGNLLKRLRVTYDTSAKNAVVDSERFE
jgi:hypothetical protein